MRKRILAKLLHYANSCPSDGDRFYELKKRLLLKYGTYKGDTLQKIEKPCWGEWDYMWHEYGGCEGEQCTRCCGTGVFQTIYHRLMKFEFCGFHFFIPEGSTSIPPEDPESVTITGRIEHQDYGLWSSEAELWLYLLAGEWRQFFGQFRGSFYVNPGCYPLLRTQKILAKVYNFFRNLRRNIKWKIGKVRDRIWPPEVPF